MCVFSQRMVMPIHYCRGIEATSAFPPLRRSPPLRSLNRDNYVPLQVFGFPVSLEKLDEWAKVHGIGRDEKQDTRQQIAWQTIMKERPAGWIALQPVYDNNGRPMRGIILATNESVAKLARASNFDLIQKYKMHLATDEEPGWYRPYN
jgi:hypothetical protein